MVERFAEEGAWVALTARDEVRMESIAADLPGESLIVPANVRDRDAVERVLAETFDIFGRVDTLVNNAGVSQLGRHDERREIPETEPSDWETIITVNPTGVFYFTRATPPHLYERERGNVINFSSGLRRYAIDGDGAYVASKWYLEGFTRVTHLEGEDRGVNANALNPGGRVNTDIWAHLPEEEPESILQPDVMDGGAVLLAAQGPDGVSGDSMDAEGWEERSGSG